jgi:hypothetical protein
LAFQVKRHEVQLLQRSPPTLAEPQVPSLLPVLNIPAGIVALLQRTIENFRQNTTLRWEGVFRLAVWLRIAVRLEVDDVTHFVCEYFADAYGSTPGLLFGDAACNTLRAVGQTPLVRARRVDAWFGVYY